MPRHGIYQNVEFKDGILYTTPKKNFSVSGVKQLENLVRAKVPENQNWALFERPKNEAALTPEAMARLAEIYASFAALGCVAIAVEVPAVFGSGIKKSLENVSSLPFYASEHHDELLAFLNQHLDVEP